ncbi:MAG: hypothetical protein MK066_09435 [Crocinitomicaceae bacterium]|nr:hypothetical protein [Crocinitomicaceae bacterium]
MSKATFSVLILCVLLVACGSNSEENGYAEAADTFCSCMSEKISENKDDIIKNVNIGLCALEVEVDYKDKRFVEALETKCSEIAVDFQRYLN